MTCSFSNKLIFVFLSNCCQCHQQSAGNTCGFYTAYHMLEAMEILGMDNSLVQINLSLWFFVLHLVSAYSNQLYPSALLFDLCSKNILLKYIGFWSDDKSHRPRCNGQDSRKDCLLHNVPGDQPKKESFIATIQALIIIEQKMSIVLFCVWNQGPAGYETWCAVLCVCIKFDLVQDDDDEHDVLFLYYVWWWCVSVNSVVFLF